MRNLIFLFALFFSVVLNGQSTEISIVVASKGATEEDAKTSALRSAIEQAFGTFVSSRTEILNDELLQDQIVSVSNGNIKKFEVLSSLYLPDQKLHLITLNATVSLDKLASFVQSKGYNDVSFDGGGFTMNLKLQRLNASSEIVAIQNLLEQGLTLSEGIFDRELQVGTPSLEKPKQIQGSHLYTIPKYQVPLRVITKLNANWYSYYDFYKKTLTEIAMSKEEVATYKKLNKAVYTLVGKEYRKKKNSYIDDTLNFRTEDALCLLTSFQVLLNAKYLEGVRISHDLGTIDLEIKYDAKYRIATRKEYNDGDVWFIDVTDSKPSMPFENYSNRLVYLTNSLSYNIHEFFSFSEPGGGWRISDKEKYNYYVDIVGYDYILPALHSSNYMQSIKIMARNISSGGFLDGYMRPTTSESLIIFDVNRPRPMNKSYGITINARFTEDELEKINKFKLLN